MNYAPARRDRGILAAAIQAGRIVVDVFGLGSLVQKIEDYFGKRITGALLVLVLITAFILCLNVIITFGLIPLVQLVRGAGAKSVLDLLPSLLTALAGGVLGTAMMQLLLGILLRRLKASAEAATERTGELIEEARKLIDAASERSDEASAMIRDAESRNEELIEREKEMERLRTEMLKVLETSRKDATKAG